MLVKKEEGPVPDDYEKTGLTDDEEDDDEEEDELPEI